AVPARLQAEPPILTGDVSRSLIELGARGIPALHRIVGDDVDAPADIIRGNRLSRPLKGGGRLRKHDQQQRDHERTSEGARRKKKLTRPTVCDYDRARQVSV